VPLISAADIDFLLADLGVVVVSAQSTTRGIPRVEDGIEQTDGAPIQRRVTTLLIRTGTITDLAEDLPLTVDGVSYVARWFGEQDDGQLTKVLVTAVTA
jgi:hypothetical protein